MPAFSASRVSCALALLLSAAVTHAVAALPAGVSCQVTTPAAKTALQKASDTLLWGKWASFEERDVQFSGLPAPDASPRYHLLMKRPGAQPATDKPLVLFLHGFPEFSWSWETWLQQFGAEHDSIAIDLKGYGSSTKPTDVAAYDIQRLSDELDALIGCMGYKQVIPVGHDWGASLAWTFAFRHPERLKALVILSTPHTYTFARELAQPDSEQRQRSQYIVDIRSGKVTNLLSLGASAGPGSTTLLSSPFYKGARLNRLVSANFSTNAKLNAMLNYYRALQWPTPEQFPAQPTAEALKAYGVQVPTLAFWGTGDTYFSPKSWDGVQAFVPQIDLRAVDGADHWLDHNTPELPTQVLDFVNQHSR
jgi:pimeloyl-ACP methyl ester carboxylesterase